MLDVYDILPKLTKYWQELSRPQSAAMQPKYTPVPLYTLHNNQLHQVCEVYLDGNKIILRTDPKPTQFTQSPDNNTRSRIKNVC